MAIEVVLNNQFSIVTAQQIDYIVALDSPYYVVTAAHNLILLGELIQIDVTRLSYGLFESDVLTQICLPECYGNWK